MFREFFIRAADIVNKRDLIIPAGDWGDAVARDMLIIGGFSKNHSQGEWRVRVGTVNPDFPRGLQAGFGFTERETISPSEASIRETFTNAEIIKFVDTHAGVIGALTLREARELRSFREAALIFGYSGPNRSDPDVIAATGMQAHP